MPKPPSAVRSDKNVVFKTDAAEMAVLLLKTGIIHAPLVEGIALKLSNERRDEIYSRLIRNHIPRNESACHTEIRESHPALTLLVIVIANIVLAVVLHIVNIKSHIVPQTVRHKEASDAVSGKLSRVTGDKAGSFQSFKHLGNSRDVNLAIGDAGTNH